MTDNTIIPSPLLDRTRVAEAIRRQVHLGIHPIHAKAAVHGMPVDLTEEQSLKVADAALAALVNAHPIDGKAWLIEANRDWQQRAQNADQRRHALVALARRELSRWRATAITAWGYFGNLTGQVELHWPRWSTFGIIPVVVGGIWLAERRSNARARSEAGAR